MSTIDMAPLPLPEGVCCPELATVSVACMIVILKSKLSFMHVLVIDYASYVVGSKV